MDIHSKDIFSCLQGPVYCESKWNR